MITQNVTPITPLPSFLAPERPAAVDNLVEAELPLLTEELAEVINQINSTETNINNKESSVTNKYNEIQPHFDEIDLVAAAIASGDMPTIIDDTDISTSKTWSSEKINSTVDIHSKTEKTTLVDADEFMTADSTSSFSLKKITWASIKTLLANLFISKVTSTDNAVVRFNGTTGDIQNSGVIIDDSGNVGIGVSSPTVKLDVSGQIRASSGILFGTDTASENMLNDYERGNWTPTVGGTWSSNPYDMSGTYVKIGNLVTVKLRFKGGTKASGASGWIDGLPFSGAEGGGGTLSNVEIEDRGAVLLDNGTRVWFTLNSFGDYMHKGTFTYLV